MFRKSFFLVPLFLTLLAACNTASDLGAEAPLELAPTFGSASADTAEGLAKHSTGVYVVGFTNGNLYGTNRGSSDAYIGRYTGGGTVLWGKQFGTSGGDPAEGVASDGGNDAYVVGSTTGTMAGALGHYDIFLRKYTASGGVAWTKQFGSGGYDGGKDVAVYGASVYAVGFVNRSQPNSQGDYDGILRKYSSSGSLIWSRWVGTGSFDIANDVVVDEVSNVYVVGSTTGPLGRTDVDGSDMFIRKYNPAGTVLWTRQLNYGSQDTGNAVAVSGSSVYLVGGYLYANSSADPDLRVVKYTAGGAQVWDAGPGSTALDYAHDVSADADGNVYFAGETSGAFAGPSRGGYDGYVVKWSTNGDPLVDTSVPPARTGRTPSWRARPTRCMRRAIPSAFSAAPIAEAATPTCDTCTVLPVAPSGLSRRERKGGWTGVLRPFLYP